MISTPVRNNWICKTQIFMDIHRYIHFVEKMPVIKSCSFSLQWIFSAKLKHFLKLTHNQWLIWFFSFSLYSQYIDVFFRLGLYQTSLAFWESSLRCYFSLLVCCVVWLCRNGVVETAARHSSISCHVTSIDI